MPDWYKIYHRLPYPMKVLAASARGRYLSRWRYSAATESMVNEFLSHEQWSADRWRIWQEERLATILRRAAADVPYYREQWAQRRANGDKASPDLLENWPLLSKEALRREPRAFLADDCDPEEMYFERTGGTTGTQQYLWLSKETLGAWFALFEARSRRWYGVGRHDRWAILGGQLVAPVRRDKPPFWVWNMAMHQLYLSVYHLSPKNIPAYLGAIRDHRIVYLLGYPSAIYRLALEMLDQKLVAPPLKVVITNAETLLDYQREAIAAAFQCPVRDAYGMAEIAAAAGECEMGNMHIWPEAGHIEILADTTDEPLPAGQAGRLIATGLLNPDMPLIRYQTGDRATRTDESCSCGRTLPLLQGIDGRVEDVVITRDGRHVGRLDGVFKADPHIREAQIIQEDWDKLRVLFVPAEGYSPRDGDIIVQRLHDRVGDDMTVVLEAVDEVPRMANGKFRAILSRLERPSQAGSAP